MWLSYNKKLKQCSRDLRNNSTLGEIMLWKRLRASQMCGYTFNRQKPIGNFIVDFYCKPLFLVIEIDGKSHLNEEVSAKDLVKEKYLISQGLTVIRFTEKQVRFDLNNICAMISNAILIIEEERGLKSKSAG